MLIRNKEEFQVRYDFRVLWFLNSKADQFLLIIRNYSDLFLYLIKFNKNLPFLVLQII